MGVICKEGEWWLNNGIFDIQIILKGFQLLVMIQSRMCLADERN